MDLTSIREDLRGDNYNTPLEFCEDVRRVFSNAQIYLEVHPNEEVYLFVIIYYKFILM